MGQVANGIAIFGVFMALIGGIIVAIGPDFRAVDEQKITTKILAPGESFTVFFNMERFDKAICNLESDGLADVTVKSSWYTIENTVRSYPSFSGKFDFRNSETRDYTGFDVIVTNPAKLNQGTITYTLTSQQFRETPSGYVYGFTFLFLGSLVAVFSAFKPDGRKLNHSFFKAKLIDTTFRMAAISIAFIGVLIVEISQLSGFPTNFSSFVVDPKNIILLIFSLAAFSIFPLAVFSYFVAPKKIEQRWKLDRATKDSQLQETCNRLAKEMGISNPPTALLTNEPNATCFIFGINLRNYKLVISSKVKDVLNEMELKAVISHELSHALHRDMIFMTWGEVYLNFSKYWVLSIVAGVIILAAISIDLANPILFISIFSLLAFGYSYFLINAISRDRELLSDIRAANQTNVSDLKSALIKVKALGLNITVGNRLLFYSAIDEKFSGAIKGIIRVLFATHPTLRQRVDTIEGTNDVNFVSASSVVHIGLVAGFSYLFFSMTTDQIFIRQTGDSHWILSMIPGAIVIGFLYGLYFAYQSIGDTFFDKGFNKAKKAIVIWISSVLAQILGNTLVFFIGLALFLKFDWQQSVIILMMGTFVFAMAFPLSIIFQSPLRYILK